MIFAELHGKLGTDGSRVHDGLEDLLTSTAFGHLRYLSLEEGFLSLLRRVRGVEVTSSGVRAAGNPAWMDLHHAASVEAVFWPSFERHGQPDVLLSFKDVSGAPVGVVLVEAKLYSPKSGSAGPDAGEAADDEVPDPDQLVKYWQGLQRYCRSVVSRPTALVYLTAHAFPPLGELGDALRRVPTMRLGWLSWFDVFEVAAACDALPARDLSKLLAHKGFRGYRGFTASAVDLPDQGRFWNAPSGTTFKWFVARQTLELPATGHFWNEHEQ